MKFLQPQWFIGLACLCASVASAQPTQLNLDRSAGPARIWLSGETNHYYAVEGASDDLLTWDSLATLRLTNQNQNWFDADSMLIPRRLYRAGKLATSPAVAGDDFRLIDHLGRSRSLYYFLNATNVRAFVLLFIGNDCGKVRELKATIDGLTTRFGTNGVTFWMVDSNSGVTRSNLLAESTSLNFSNNPPFLHDPAQIVARRYHASKAPEAIALKRTVTATSTNMTIFYRGAIDDRFGTNPTATTQFYLSNALNSLLAGAPITPVAARPGGCDIALRPTPPVTYSDDVAPILLAKCVRCHSAGNIAPFSFSSYNSALGHSAQMRNAILKEEMPPWHADPNFGVFTNDSSLSPEQAAKLIQWIDEGSQRGVGPDPLTGYTPPIDYPITWPAALGAPDFVITLPTQSIPASGVLSYRYLTNDYSGPTTNLRAAIVLPGNLGVVHHVLVSDGDDNFLSSFFTGYVPGTEPLPFPTGTSKPVVKGQKFVSQMHYISMGRATNDITRIGFYFAAATPTAPLIQASAYNLFFSIPPGASDSQTTAQTAPFAKAVYLYDLSPHMHLRGSRFQYEAVYPAGHVPAREILLSVPRYDFSWQTPYRLAHPKLLPAGTSILCTGAWDNSYLNPDNPSPTTTVTFGEQTFNEMFIGFFSYSEVP